MSSGETIESAIINAKDAKKAWLEAAIEDDIQIHEPDSLKSYSRLHKENAVSKHVQKMICIFLCLQAKLKEPLRVPCEVLNNLDYDKSSPFDSMTFLYQ